MGFLVLNVLFQKKCVMNTSNGLKRSYLTTKILKIYAVGKKCQIGTFWKIAHDHTVMVAIFWKLPIWHFLPTAWIFKFLWLNNYFLSHLKYLPHILIEKVVLIQENPKFSVTKTVNSNFLILPSTELDFFNYFSFLTFVRIPGNQNWRLLVSFLFLFEIAIVWHHTVFCHEIFK